MKKLFALGICLILLGIFGLSYTYTIDHRSAPSLSAYCNIDFKSSVDRHGKLEDATLAIVDYRYASAKPEPSVTITVDDEPWRIEAAIKQTPPTYDFFHAGANTSFKITNKFFLHVPLEVLAKIAQAEAVRVTFRYDNGQVIDLPLNEPDLAYWKAQL